MAITLTKVNSFVENLAEKQIDLSGNGLTLALTNTPHTSTWSQLSDLTQISYTNLSSRVLTVSSSAQTSGTYKLVLADITLTASGTVPTFQYIYIYDANSTGNKLIAYGDYGSAINLLVGNSITLDFDATNGVLTIT